MVIRHYHECLESRLGLRGREGDLLEDGLVDLVEEEGVVGFVYRPHLSVDDFIDYLSWQEGFRGREGGRAHTHTHTIKGLMRIHGGER